MDQMAHQLGDPKVMASFSVAFFDRGHMEEWVKRNLAHQDNFGYGLFSVILKSNNFPIGDSGLERMEIGGLEEVELGYEFRSDYWNQGYCDRSGNRRTGLFIRPIAPFAAD